MTRIPRERKSYWIPQSGMTVYDFAPPAPKGGGDAGEWFQLTPASLAFLFSEDLDVPTDNKLRVVREYKRDPEAYIRLMTVSVTQGHRPAKWFVAEAKEKFNEVLLGQLERALMRLKKAESPNAAVLR